MSEVIKLFLIGAGYGFVCLIGHEYRQWKRQRSLTAAIENQRAEDRRNAEAELAKAETEWIPTSLEL